MSGKVRQERIDRYNEEGSDIFVFMLSTRAGGLGITLTSADTVVIFDSDWNLQNDLQAQDRCHRIGQTKNVVVYRLLTKNTYEMEMFHRACLKLTLDNVVMSSISKATGGVHHGKAMPFNKDEVEAMLKNGAYNVFKEEDESEKKENEFMAEAIDSILDKSRVIKYNKGDKAQEQGKSTFSKATFVPDASEAAVDLNDPEFWSKLGLTDRTVDEPGEQLVLDTKRKRKSTQHFQLTHQFDSDDDEDEQDSACEVSNPSTIALITPNNP